jgi:Fe-S cluster biogenesis protein NfuA
LDADVPQRAGMGELSSQPGATPGEYPFYTEEELDALYERDPVMAMRVSRHQMELARELERTKTLDPSLPAPTVDAVAELLERARTVLRRDGGNLELVALEGNVVTVRMTGNCAGCPRSALDLKNVVERVVRNRFPQLKVVRQIGERS